MNNPRHERAIIIVASYIIGFTTSFIAFSALGTSVQTGDVTYHTTPELGTPMHYVNKTIPLATILVEEDGLVVATEEGERLLSVYSGSPLAASVVSTDLGLSVPADHLIEAELSRDSTYVYFCEQQRKEIDICNPFVYSVLDGVTYPVTLNGSKYEPAASRHFSAWSAQGILSVNGYESVSGETPWQLQSER